MRAAESDGLENRCPEGTVGSNPTLSAIPDPTPDFCLWGSPAPPWNLPLCFAGCQASLFESPHEEPLHLPNRAVPFL